jgi:hypothetical protein
VTDRLLVLRKLALLREHASRVERRRGADPDLFAADIDAQDAVREDSALQLWYQPIDFRWARNLAAYEAAEARRFVALHEAMAPVSAVRLAHDLAIVP